MEAFCHKPFLSKPLIYTQMNYIEPFYFHGTVLNAGYKEEELKSKAKKTGQKISWTAENFRIKPYQDLVLYDNCNG